MSSEQSYFATTQWTMVWQAAKEDSQQGRPALGQVIGRYWQPLYSHARRNGLSREDAEDATQEFLQRVVSGKLLEAADPAKGKFRSFLLASWKHFLVDQYRRQNAVKRGGGAKVFSVDFDQGEQNWQQLPGNLPDPDRIFDLAWANSLLDEVRLRLRQEYASSGRNLVLEKLLPQLTRTMDSAGYQQIASQLNLNSGAVKVAMHRLRNRFGQTLRSVVLETLDDPSDLDAELAELIELMAGQS